MHKAETTPHTFRTRVGTFAVRISDDWLKVISDIWGFSIEQTWLSADPEPVIRKLDDPAELIAAIGGMVFMQVQARGLTTAELAAAMMEGAAVRRARRAVVEAMAARWPDAPGTRVALSLWVPNDHQGE